MGSSLIINDVRIFDGDIEIPNGSVLVENGKIAKVSTTPLKPSSPSTVVLSKPGHTLVPGLIDAHIHAYQGDEQALTQSLKFGVTTVCDMANEPEYLPQLRKKAAHDSDAADFKTSSVPAEVKLGWPEASMVQFGLAIPEGKAYVHTMEDAERFVAERQKDADYIKIFREDGNAFPFDPKIPDLDVQRRVIELAREKGLQTYAHALGRKGAIEILHAGIDGTAHTILDLPPNKELIDAYKLNNA